jgi:cytochrome c
MRTRFLGSGALAFLLAACTGGSRPHAVEGERAIAKYGCGYCHQIPGLEENPTIVGPPLTALAERWYIAGRLPNTPDNLVRWIMDPQGVKPGTAMPTLGVTEAEARDIAAYLYTLR